MLVAMIGILSAVALPSLVTFYQAQQLDGAARRVVTYLQEGRQLAITHNTSYRVEVDVAGSRMRYVRVSTGAPWTGAGTDGAGYKALDSDYPVDACSRTSFVFTPLGTLNIATTPAGTVRVRNATSSQRLDVTVTATGRIQATAAGTC